MGLQKQPRVMLPYGYGTCGREIRARNQVKMLVQTGKWTNRLASENSEKGKIAKHPRQLTCNADSARRSRPPPSKPSKQELVM